MPHDLPNDLGNMRKVSKPDRMIAQCQAPRQNEQNSHFEMKWNKGANFAYTSRKPLKTRN